MALGESRKKLIWSVYRLYPKSLNYCINVKLVDGKKSFKHPRGVSSKGKRRPFLTTRCPFHSPGDTLLAGVRASGVCGCVWVITDPKHARVWAHSPPRLWLHHGGRCGACLVGPFLESPSRSPPARRVSRWHQVLRQDRVSWGAGPGAQACPSQLQSSHRVAGLWGLHGGGGPPSPAFPGGRPHGPVAPP